MKKHQNVYTRRVVLAMFASSGLGLAAYKLLSPPDNASAADQAYYVSAISGSDSNTGRSPNTPFKTIQKGHDVSMPGDTIYVMNGTYAEIPPEAGRTSSEGAVQITRSGTAEAPITYRAFLGHRPVIQVSEKAWNHILVKGASYINIYGFTIAGLSANYTYEEALQNASVKIPKYNTNGITARRDKALGLDQRPHHIRIIGNEVHNCPGGGIGIEETDYVVIESNIVYSNAWWSFFANSGISLFHSYNVDKRTDYKNFIRNNITFDNQSFLIASGAKKITDGNGIIVDDNKNTQIRDRVEPPYVGRTLVVNNVSFNNGGSGIHAYSSQHVDIINNTVSDNERIVNDGALYANSAGDVNLFNNVVYVRSGKKTNDTFKNTNVTYDYNIYYNGLPPVAMGPNDLIADPLFVHRTNDFATANFSVRSDEHAVSPAIDSGTTNLAPTVDIIKRKRPAGKGIDRGAFEGPRYARGEPQDTFWRKTLLDATE